MSYYPENTIPVFDVPPMHTSPATERKNLLCGRAPLVIRTDSPIEDKYQTEYYNTPFSECERLTDGVHCTEPNYKDPAFYHFTDGLGRTIICSLGALSSVEEIRLGSLKQQDVTIHPPRCLDVRLSADGKTWMRVATERTLEGEETPVRSEYRVVFEKPYKALYVAVDLEIWGHVWVDEIEAWGTEAIPADAVDITPEDAAPTPDVGAYPAPDTFDGLHNLLLSYNCVPPEKIGNNHYGSATAEEYLPHLVYFDRAGKPVDTFFDGFLYLPYSLYTYSTLYKCASGWNYYIDNVFRKGYNLDALSEATHKAGELLGIPDHKVKVYFSILHTNVAYGEHPDSFGDIDGDGVDEDMNVLSDRIKAIKWCIDTQIERFRACGYDNLELCGFYWFEELINYRDPLEKDSLKFAVDYLHSMGLKIFWIPFFQAQGFRDWEENGFDIASMQPNYGVRANVRPFRLYQNAAMAKKYGLAVEMEICRLEEEFVERFRQYMDCGAETGYMNTVKMYYQNGVPGVIYESYKSEDDNLRSLYDDLYLFAKEKYVSRKER